MEEKKKNCMFPVLKTRKKKAALIEVKPEKPSDLVAIQKLEDGKIRLRQCDKTDLADFVKRGFKLVPADKMPADKVPADKMPADKVPADEEGKA